MSVPLLSKRNYRDREALRIYTQCDVHRECLLGPYNDNLVRSQSRYMFKRTLPEEVAEAQHKYTDTNKLYDFCERGVEILNVKPEHGRESQWTEPLHKRG